MTFTKTPVNKNDAHAMLKEEAYSIVNNIPATEITSNGSMANAEANQLTMRKVHKASCSIALQLGSAVLPKLMH